MDELLVNLKNGQRETREAPVPPITFSAADMALAQHEADVRCAIDRLKYEALSNQVVADILTVLGVL